MPSQWARWVAVTSLIAGGASAFAASAGAEWRLPLPGAEAVNGLILITLTGIVISIILSRSFLRGWERIASWLSLLIAAGLCMAALAGASIDAGDWAQDAIREAGNRFWTLFDLILYTVMAIVFSNALLLSGRGKRGRGDDDDDDRNGEP